MSEFTQLQDSLGKSHHNVVIVDDKVYGATEQYKKHCSFVAETLFISQRTCSAPRYSPALLL